MVIDSSALVAILFQEPEHHAFTEAIDAASIRRLSAPNLVETALVIEGRKGERGRIELDLLIYEAGIEITAFDAAQADFARIAWRSFGKGRHSAALNMGDCYAYALARVMNEPLLFKGNDFSQTDITPAV